MNISCQLVDFR